MLCELCHPSALSLQEIQIVSPLLQGTQADIKRGLDHASIRTIRAIRRDEQAQLEHIGEQGQEGEGLGFNHSQY